MPRAVRFEQYGGVEVLDVVEVEPPEPDEGQMLIRVRAAGINPFETKLRSGVFRDDIKLSFPAAEGSDIAGVVEQVGPGVTDFAPGDEIFGTTSRRGSHAELAVVSRGQVLARPAELPWKVAGGLWTIGTTAYASVSAVSASPGDVIVVTGAAGGVGGLAAQLARNLGAQVVGIAGERNSEWLRSHDIVPVVYGEGLAERLTDAVAAAGGGAPNALIDTAGQGYVAFGVELGIAPERINTIADDEGAARYGAKTDGGRAGARVEVVEELARAIVDTKLDLPIAATFPLDRVREAYTLLEDGHPPGKIVLIP